MIYYLYISFELRIGVSAIVPYSTIDSLGTGTMSTSGTGSVESATGSVDSVGKSPNETSGSVFWANS